MPLSNTDLWLELGAKFSVLASILVIIYFCGFTAWRIARFQNHPWNFWSTSRREIAHTSTLMPFTLTLKEDTVNEMDQLTFHLICKIKPSIIKLMWAVDASYLLKLINSPSWDHIRELEDLSLSDSNSSSSFSGPSRCSRLYSSVEDLRLRLLEDGTFESNVTVVSPKELDWKSLVNQYKYPLAIFILASKESTSAFHDPSKIIGLSAILHVKNSTIPKPSTIHAQYIKLQNGQAHLLQSLYVMDGADGGYDDTEETNFQSANGNNQPFGDILCSVCQSLPVSRAIIPCRHVCLCAHCFTKVESCPICRGFISCYFKTRDESYMNDYVHSS